MMFQSDNLFASEDELQPFPLSFSTVTAFSKPVIQELSMNQTGGNVDDLG
jgi:hypothetical protein